MAGGCGERKHSRETSKMKFLPVAVVFALVVFSAAVPVKRDEEVADELTLEDVNEALDTLDLIEVSASESQLYFLKKIKRAIKRGVKIDVRIRPASAQLDSGAGLSFEELRDMLDAYENLEEMTSDSNYGLWKKVKKGLKKVGKVIEKGAKKVLEGGIGVNVPI